ncbi:MAG TPA: hypothetical protein VM754_13485 [Actinomycetota bacterium]|nr:hypothetical protein [Actinomycetota bacterium]
MTVSDEVSGWFAGRIPDGLYEGPPEITADREEVLIVGTIAEPQLGDDASVDAATAARAGRINQHREDTRRERMKIAAEAEARFGKKVSWGVQCGADRVLFTNLSMPVMTRLRMPERQVLDRLVDAGVAKSRSHALAWCVRLVGQNQQEWLEDLKEALTHVEEVRASGPAV